MATMRLDLLIRLFGGAFRIQNFNENVKKIQCKRFSSGLTAKLKTEIQADPIRSEGVVPSLTQSSAELHKKISSPLADKFGRYHTYLRISLTERCNLRCKYCMPADGVQLTQKSNLLTTDEILYLGKLFVEQGVRKIRLTGGEPTVRKDIVEIIEKLKKIPQLDSLGITTNGIMLTRLLVSMQKAGLDAINISLDTLKASKYEQITRRKGWERVIAGIDLAIQLGYKPKINCVLMKKFNDDEICDFVEFTKDRNVDIRFIEYMPFTGNKWQTDKMVSFKETLDTIKAMWPNFQALPNGPNDTSKAYTVPGFAGQLGFITSMTEHFCGTCNRLRLTADGNLKVCLFGNKEISLRDAIRSNCSESDLIALISSAVKRKKKQHADLISIKPKQNKSTMEYLNFYSPFIVSMTPSTLFYSSKRLYCTVNEMNLTHVNEKGKAKMVDVSKKVDTIRSASARAIVYVGPVISKLIYNNNIKKGDVLTLSEIAGVIAAKRTSDLIPLCHNIPLSSVKVEAELLTDQHEVFITSTVRCEGKTGVEMEALTAATIAALTVYDMCKVISHNIIIKDIMLMAKSGGKREFMRKIDKQEITLKYNTDPIEEKEPFYPTHI